jgi:hypothetical protein
MTSPVDPCAPNDADSKPSAMMTRRRTLLVSTAMLLAAPAAQAVTLQGGAGLPWRPFAGDPPEAVKPGPWMFFTPEEGAAVEALVDRLIPPIRRPPAEKSAAAQSSSTASWRVLMAVQLAFTGVRRSCRRRQSWAFKGHSRQLSSTGARWQRSISTVAPPTAARRLRSFRIARTIRSSPRWKTGRCDFRIRLRSRSSRHCCRIRARASLPTPFTAAIAIWRPGK